ncbi:MAG: FtsW/RodA/SpoVE family cell cycle protein [Oscillospiraceae bacterium]|nr:FtsW/RodA/SpoVE family cell cycle protein [Oscillospiraceae bacterium]
MKVLIKAIAKFFSEADVLLLALSLISVVYGIVLVYSVVRNFETGNEFYVQIGATVIGLGLFVLFSYVDIDIIADKSVLLLIFSALFISTLQFWGVGMEEVGNNAWLRFAGIGIQPAEVVKIPFIIIIAKMITTFRERKSLNNFLSLVQIVLVFGVLTALILGVSADLGSALVYAFILLAMLFVGGVKLRWFAIGAAIVAAVFPFFWANYMTDLQRARVMAPFPFFADTLGVGVYDRINWQANQSVSAIASGGFLGQGLGNGRFTQNQSIPAQHTDFIFSAAGEELGFLGCLIIVGLLVSVIVRCVYVGVKSNNSLGMLVCTGVAAMLIIHTISNIGMNLRMLPVIGIGLPFFSYGGSAIVTCMAAMGIVSGIKMRPKPYRFRSL